MKEKNCAVSFNISLLWLKKKIPIGSVRLPSVVVDDGPDALAMILGQDC